jgi:hypothetical protein
VISWLLSIKGKLFIVSSVAERAVREEFRKLASIKLFDELFKHSELTDEDCLKLGKEVNKAVRLRIEGELSA